MRSVKVDRKPRAKPRAQPCRARRARKRDLPVQPGSARGRDRRRAAAASRCSCAAPCWHCAPLLLALVLVGALLASGVVGRSVHAVGSGIDSVVGRCRLRHFRNPHHRQSPHALTPGAGSAGHEAGQIHLQRRSVGRAEPPEALDWIASAEVHRRYPDAIFVTLVEKRPFALWQLPPKQGRSAHRRGGTQRRRHHQPRCGKIPPPAQAGGRRRARQRRRTGRCGAGHIAPSPRASPPIPISSQRRWNLLLDDGVTVQLPEIGWQKQLDALEHLIIDSGILERDISEIDLRSPTHYFFILKSGEKKDVERGKET